MTTAPTNDAEITPAEQRRAGLVERCAQCWRFRELTSFIGPSGRFVQNCAGCRARYSNWHRRSPIERLRARRPVRRTGNGYRVTFVRRSNNRKTGPIPVSITDMASCPSSCPQLDAGCYAGYGKTAFHWRNAGLTGLAWKAFCGAVRALPAGTLWRHNEAGDLPGAGDLLDRDALRQLVRANHGRRGFTFTHKPLRDPDDRRAVLEANDAGFRVNLSADTLADADRLADLRIGPVAVVLPQDAPRRATRTPAGRHVIVCPAITSPGMTCQRCQLCQKSRVAIVGFPAHGQAAALVTLRIRGSLR